MSDIWNTKKDLVLGTLDGLGVGLDIEIKREHFPKRAIDLTWFYVHVGERCVSVMAPTSRFIQRDAQALKDEVTGRVILSLAVEDMKVKTQSNGDGTYTHTFTANDYKDFAGV